MDNTDHQLDVRERTRGILLAQACGDALGVPYEKFGGNFGVHAHEVSMKGGGYGDLAAGQFSDDTAMAVAIADVLARGYDLDAIAENFLRWYHEDAGGIGRQTRAVMIWTDAEWSDGTPMSATMTNAADRYHVKHPKNSAGNGALMRNGIVAASCFADRYETLNRTVDIARLTHVDPLVDESCALMSEIIRQNLSVGSFSLDDVCAILRNDERSSWWNDELRKAARSNPRDYFHGSGFTVTAMLGAFSCLFATDTIEQCLRTAVVSASDADTVAAIAGAMAGSIYGWRELPQQWLDIVHGWPDVDADDLITMADGIAARAHVRD